ncbi:glutathione S-transferase [Caerostris extrusa]|uniref:glutathione transferase n=1 Tax=Caerostris extrusa TaxID=172846 RepID=A0AAV4UQX2_CAEEX|nr:glutathione S-transferase [Caerostris extrusa]
MRHELHLVVAEPIRFLLHYKQIDFVDKRYAFGTDDWQNDKRALGLDFPNLPYFIDGDVKLTQSITIMRYLAEKYGMDGKDDQQNFTCTWPSRRFLIFD